MDVGLYTSFTQIDRSGELPLTSTITWDFYKSYFGQEWSERSQKIVTIWLYMPIITATLLSCYEQSRNIGRGSTDSAAEQKDSRAGSVCGNGLLEKGEQCDGDNLNGQTCSSMKRGGGELECQADKCTFNFMKCDEESVNDASDLGNVRDATVEDDHENQLFGHLVDVDGGLNTAQSCKVNSDCVNVAVNCFCRWPQIEDVAAINRRWVDHWVSPSCNIKCESPSSAWLIPYCKKSGQNDLSKCEAIDLSVHPLTKCETKEDCQMRVRECCECGGNTAIDQVIAMPQNNFEDYQYLICDKTPPECEKCEPNYPPTVGLGNIAEISCYEGHCRVESMYVDPI
ncbi:MAG: hypothetical protein JXA30_02805 [Deltaproteobacteria bacterium]|nr:hypothetical protein [Deltaproteobacteria bacterium]